MLARCKLVLSWSALSPRGARRHVWLFPWGFKGTKIKGNGKFGFLVTLATCPALSSRTRGCHLSTEPWTRCPSSSSPPTLAEAGATRASLKGRSPSDTARKSWTFGGSSLPAGCAPARWGSAGFQGVATRTDGKNAATALPCKDAGTSGGAGFPSLPPFLLCAWPIGCARVETDNLTPPCFV